MRAKHLNGQFEKWERKTRAFEPEMDISVDEAVEDGILKEGDDILDLYLAREKTEKTNELNLAM